MDPSSASTSMLVMDWTKLERKEKSTIWLCDSILMLLNVLGESITKSLWEKLGTLYHSNSLVSIFFSFESTYTS